MQSLTLLALFVALSAVSATLVQKSEIRAKRQWGGGWNNGGWNGGPGGWNGGQGGNGWQQQNWNRQNSRNKISAQENKYNCQTEGIDILGMPISEYSCQTSGQSAKVKTSQQNQQMQGFMNGPIGAIMSEFGR